MSTKGGPNIIKDGLVLYLDAANPKSFRGEPTENLLSDGINGYNAFDPSHWNGADPVNIGVSPLGVPTFEYDTTESVYTYTHDYVLDDDLSTISEKVVTFSLYIRRVEGAATGRIRIYDNVSAYTYKSINVTTEFQRFEMTKTIGASPTRAFVMIDNTGGGTYQFYGTQLEIKPYATPFVNGVRGSTVETGGGWVDLSGNGNHATLVGNNDTFTFNTNGYFEHRPLGINGSSDGTYSSTDSGSYWEVSSSNTLQSSINKEWTVCGFCRTFGNQSSNGVGWFHKVGSGGGNCIHLEHITNDFRVNGDSGYNDGFVSDINEYYGQFIYISVTYKTTGVYGTDNGELNVYINSKLVDTDTTFIPDGDDGSTDIWLGRRNGHFRHMFNGDIVNYEYYRKELSHVEIQKNYNALKSRFNL